jgi:hypothetical protein
MHLKVFVKLKKNLKTLSTGQKNPKKPKKPPKTQKKPKNPLGRFFFKKRVFSNPGIKSLQKLFQSTIPVLNQFSRRYTRMSTTYSYRVGATDLDPQIKAVKRVGLRAGLMLGLGNLAEEAG